MSVDHDTRRRALEQIRFADRVIGGAIGSLQRLARQQRLDGLGAGNDGYFGEHDRNDNASAAIALVEGQQAFEVALKMLGSGAAQPPVELERWGLAEGVLDGLFDLLALVRAKKNLQKANELHLRFVEVFDVIRGSDPALADVAPLSDWDLSLGDVIQGALGFHSPWAIALVAAAGLGIVVLLILY